MARSRLTRALAIVWDRNAARQMQAEADAAFQKVAASGSKEFEQGMREGGRKAARTLTRALQQEYRVRMAQARLALAEGTIDEKAFEREGIEAAQAFNRGLTGGMRRLRAQGNTDALTLAGLSTGFKREPGIGRAGIFGGLALGGFAAPLAGVLSVGAALNESRQMIEASDEMERSVRRLAGTAKLAGIELGTLTAQAEANREAFKLGTPIANDLTGVMARLAGRAGDLTQSQRALGAWLDLAASGGLTAAEAMQALEVTFRGQDEGLNRLGLANPADIYKKWGAGADDASKAQAILNEIIAEGAKVQGEWARAAQTSSGQADQQRQKIRDLQAEAGEAIRPFQLFALELKVGLYTVLGQLIERIGTAISKWREWVREHRASSESLRMGMLSGGSRSGTMENTIGAPSGFSLARIHAVPSHLPARATPPPPPAPPSPPSAEEIARVKAMQDRLAAIPERWMGMGGPEGGSIISEPIDAANESWEEYLDIVQRASEVSQEAAYQMARSFQDAFQLMADEGATLGNFLEGIARGIGGAMLAGLAQFAQGKVAENVAAAIEAVAYALGFTSHGNFASASAAWASAGQHTAAAVAWGALAGGAGFGSGAVTGGAGAVPPSTRDAGLDIAQRAEINSQPITIYVDPFNPSNPVHAKGVGEAMELDVRLGGRPAWAVAR